MFKPSEQELKSKPNFIKEAKDKRQVRTAGA